MQRIEPTTLRGPRSHFTALDYRIVSRTRDIEKLRKTVERRLKALLLVKSSVVCAASHLGSRFAYELFKDSPRLLVEAHVIPAFRSDRHDFAEFFKRKRFKEKNDAIAFYHDHVSKTVNWDLLDNSVWFRDRFLEELQDEKSVVRRHLSGKDDSAVAALIAEVSSDDKLERAQIEKAAKGLSVGQRRILLNFRELVYHISGARVVNCESCLPQENYIDYDLADISQQRTRLSEEMVLWKLLLELVCDSMQMKMLPIELLDALSFDDIIAIREPLLDSAFQKKYDALIKAAVSDVAQHGGNRLHSVHDLERIRGSLRATFAAVIDEELPSFMRKMAGQHTKELASVSSSVVLGLMGLNPIIGLASSTISVLKDTPALLLNVNRTLSSAKSVQDVSLHVQMRSELLKKQIGTKSVSDRSVMLDMVDLLVSHIRHGMTL